MTTELWESASAVAGVFQPANVADVHELARRGWLAWGNEVAHQRQQTR